MTPSAASIHPDARTRFAALYEELLPVVYGYARSRLSVQDAEDVTADVFRSAIERLRDDPTAELNKSWFLTATRNRIIDRWRRSMRWEGRLELLKCDVDVIDGSSEASDRVLDALDRLPADYRAVLLLRFVDRCSAREIADAMGRKTRAVESLLVRARRAFLEAFEAVGS